MTIIPPDIIVAIVLVTLVLILSYKDNHGK